MKNNHTYNNPLAAASKWLRGTVAAPNQNGLLDRTLQARRDGIHEEPLGDKLILFDSFSRQSVTLDAVAAFVWKRCDGETSVAQIIAAHGQGEAEVLRALEVLEDGGLLIEELPPQAVTLGNSRRQFLRRGGIAAGVTLFGSLLGAPRLQAAAVASTCPVSGFTLIQLLNYAKTNHRTLYRQALIQRRTGTAPATVRDNLETAICNTFAVPVDCGGVWSEYSTCSVSCGGGAQVRTFTVLTAAANGGAACPVSPETQDCNTQACQAAPVDCAGTWSAWSSCSASCGDGTQTRIFNITTPAANGGAACPVSPESQSCAAPPCPVVCPNCFEPSDRCQPDGSCIHLCPDGGVGDCCTSQDGGATFFNDC